MKRILSNAFTPYLHYYIFIAVVGIYLFTLSEVRTNYNRTDKVLNEDAFGYYTILPALFKYHDPEFKFIESDVRKLPAYNNYTPPVINEAPNGRKVCKYYSGVALLQLPFYFAADVIMSVKGTTTGYEQPYHNAILISAIFYLVLGLFQTMRILIRLGIQNIIASLIISLVLFGTNLYCYATYDPAYSHVYSYFALVCFVSCLLSFKNNINTRNAVLCGLFFGLIILIRPLNGISILFAPVIFGTAGLRTLFSRPHAGKILLAGCCVPAVLSIQSFLWHWQTGLWYVYPYGTEKMDLLNPRMGELVFGFDSGWAVYTPLPFLVLVFALLALWFKKDIFRALGATVCALAIIYLLSCWYYLHYGCTVGCRPITEFYGPLFILFAYASRNLFVKKWFRLTFFSLSAVLLYYNQVIHFQFYENIMNWCNMDRSRFQSVFMKTEPVYRYATANFWDLTGYEKKPYLHLHVDKTLAIRPDKAKDTFSFQLPPLDLYKSSLLLEFYFTCKMDHEINESFVRMLHTTHGEYIDLQQLLLKRKVNRVDQSQEFIYELIINKSIPESKIHFSLESVDGHAVTTLQIRDILVNRINY